MARVRVIFDRFELRGRICVRNSQMVQTADTEPSTLLELLYSNISAIACNTSLYTLQSYGRFRLHQFGVPTLSPRRPNTPNHDFEVVVG